jgi:hypothetical protein
MTVLYVANDSLLTAYSISELWSSTCSNEAFWYGQVVVFSWTRYVMPCLVRRSSYCLPEKEQRRWRSDHL